MGPKRIMSAYSKSHEQVSEALRCMSGNFDDACHFLEHNCSKTGKRSGRLKVCARKCSRFQASLRGPKRTTPCSCPRAEPAKRCSCANEATSTLVGASSFWKASLFNLKKRFSLNTLSALAFSSSVVNCQLLYILKIYVIHFIP